MKSMLRYGNWLFGLIVFVFAFLLILNYFTMRSDSENGEICLFSYNEKKESETVNFYNIEYRKGLFDGKLLFTPEKQIVLNNVRVIDRNLRYINQNNELCFLRDRIGNGIYARDHHYKQPIYTRYYNWETEIVYKDIDNGKEFIWIGGDAILSDRFTSWQIDNLFSRFFMFPGHSRIIRILMNCIYMDLLNLDRNRFSANPEAEIEDFIGSSDYIDMDLTEKIDNVAVLCYSCFNPEIKNNKISISSLTGTQLFLNFDYYNYLHKKKYDDKCLKEYLDIKNKNMKPLEKLKESGWTIFVSDLKIVDCRKNERPPSVKPRRIVSSYPIFFVDDSSNIVPIPHKCWSPDGSKILFVGSLDEPGRANVYTVDINTEKIETILKADDESGKFNPDLEWTEHGMLITCKNAVYLKENGRNLITLHPGNSNTEYSQAKLSPSGKIIAVICSSKDGNYLIFSDKTGRKLLEKQLKDGNPDDFQFCWRKTNDCSIIKNEDDWYLIPDNKDNDDIREIREEREESHRKFMEEEEGK